MTKAYDFAFLMEKLKAEGIEIAEETAKKVLKVGIDWVEESCKLSENKFDDFFVVVRPMLEPAILEQVEKINPAD